MEPSNSIYFIGDYHLDNLFHLNQNSKTTISEVADKTIEANLINELKKKDFIFNIYNHAFDALTTTSILNDGQPRISISYINQDRNKNVQKDNFQYGDEANSYFSNSSNKFR